jgi:phage/plasmid-associated DNA primase
MNFQDLLKLPMPSIMPNETTVKKCQGGPIPGVSECDDDVHMDNMCEFHYEEFQIKEREKKMREEKKRRDEEKKKAKSDKYDSNDQIYSILDNGKIVGYECKIDVSDKAAAVIYTHIMKDDKGNSLIHRDGSNVCIFDELSGIWKTDDESLKKSISEKSIKLFQLKRNEDGKWERAKKCVNYSETLSNINKVVEFLHFHLDDEHFINKNIESNFGKLLFDDGIYNIETNSFTQGFDPNIVFFHKMGRKFPKRDEEKIKWVEHTLFDNLFDDIKISNGLKAQIARAITGRFFKLRKATFCQGETASGKGMLTDALLKAFPGIVSTFDSNNLIMNDIKKDEAQRMMWLMKLKTVRMAISNEFRIEKTEKTGKIKSFIDSAMFKRVVSGGDVLEVRGMNKGIDEMINRASLFLMFNDCPPFYPEDEAVKDRKEEISFSKSFVMKPDPRIPNQKLRDITIKDKVLEPEYIDALFWVVCDSYSNLVKDKPYISIPKEIIEEEVEEDIMTVESVLREYYDFGLETDKVPNKEIYQLLYDKLGITDRSKIKSEFKKLRQITGLKFQSDTNNKRGNLIKKPIL